MVDRCKRKFARARVHRRDRAVYCGRVKGLVVSVLVTLVGCAPKVEAPAPLPPLSDPTPPEVRAVPAVTASPSSAPEPQRRSRRGECDVQQALSAFVGGEPSVRCGSITSRAEPAAFDALRKCILDAARRKASFVADIRISGIDSVFWEAYAGRMAGATYEVRNFSYDSCPSGCGDEDPMWLSYRCKPLLDADKACKARKLIEQEEGLRFFCEDRADGGGHGDPRRNVRALLGVWCSGWERAESCPAEGIDAGPGTDTD